MNRNFLNWCVDGCLALAALGLLLTGMVMLWVLPQGSGEASVWSLTRHEWGDVHLGFAVAAVALLVVHLTLHWGWIIIVTAKTFGRRSTQPITGNKPLAGALAVIVLLAVVIGFLFAASCSVVPDQRQRGPGRGWGHESRDARAPLILNDTLAVSLR